jgi:hypothetical protein
MGNRTGAYRDLMGDLRERDNLENIGVDGRIILSRIFKKSCRSMNWFNVAQDRDRWWTGGGLL